MTNANQGTIMPEGNMLIINPEYVHFDGTKSDSTAVLPLGVMHAGQILETRGVSVTYQDNQLHSLRDRSDIGNFDSYGITVMGAQNNAVAYRNYNILLENGVSPKKIFFGGQGVEDFTKEEFQKIYPGANKVHTISMMGDGYWGTTINEQLNKISDEDMATYLKNEVAILFSQGCKYGCTFCGAKTTMPETFFEVEGNLEAYLKKANQFGVQNLDGYVTSLDFFQQALKGGSTAKLKVVLRGVIKLQEKYGVDLRLRALVRADSYMVATTDEELMALTKEAGFYRFGFGADGAADVSLVKSMHKGDGYLKSHLIESFRHAQGSGFDPEILYVFGTGEDTFETLKKTKELCEALQIEFPASIYRGFPAKDNIPGNKNWGKNAWKTSVAYQKLLANPELFMNLGFETLANIISHENPEMRRAVNFEAVEMSRIAHELGRVQSYLTIPIMETDGHELMNEETFNNFRIIAANYVPSAIIDILTLENLPEFREEINKLIPKDI